METAGTKKALRKLHTEKETFSDTQSGFDARCLASSAWPPRQLPKIPPAVQQKQPARAHQSHVGYTPSHSSGKGTILTFLDMWGDTVLDM